ncbi:MAG: putative DNA binding domain-containing protein [Methanomassiliicoccaceae archaeon]|nr:putative DNA binding domain-containing protein [Methanomassiliicoccaceae archaeon]
MEWKEPWRIDWLRWIAAFASQEGGTLVIGKDDKGRVVGVQNHKKLLEEIPSTVKNKLGIRPSVSAMSEGGKTYVVIKVEKEGRPVPLDGVYYKRSGSTTRIVSGDELKRWLLIGWGISWTDCTAKGREVSDLSRAAIDFFVAKGIESGRMSAQVAKIDTESLLRHYDLMDKDGLKRSGAILFLEHPDLGFWGAAIMIGAFTEDNRLLRHDRIDCSAIMQPDMAMDVLLNKYIQGVDEVEWLARVVPKGISTEGISTTGHSQNMQISKIYALKICKSQKFML